MEDSEQLTNLQRLCDTVMSACIRIKEECFYIVQTLPLRIEAVLRVKDGKNIYSCIVLNREFRKENNCPVFKSASQTLSEP